ncbi:MAG: hypothetical protein ACFFG0_09750 [Candidatus Thorarchaeota archaeon]
MSFIITNPFPYLESLPFTKISIDNYFRIFSVFKESYSLSSQKLIQEVQKIFIESGSNQDIQTIVKNYIPMYKGLGIIDNELNLTNPLGINITVKENLREKQFEFLFELFHRKWFIFAFYNFYEIVLKNPNISKNEIKKLIMEKLRKNGFYVGSIKLKRRKSPNSNRIEAVWNLFFYTGIIDKNNNLQIDFIKDFEEFIKEKLKQEGQDRNLESFLYDIIRMITGILNENEVELRNITEEYIIDFYDKVRSIYKERSEHYVFIDDIEREFLLDDPKFFDKLWIMQEEGSAQMIVGRDTGSHKAYLKHGRYYTKIYIY